MITVTALLRRIVAAYAARISVIDEILCSIGDFAIESYILACRAVARKPGDIGEAEASHGRKVRIPAAWVDDPQGWLRGGDTQ
jgi:hypothetical protein